MICTTCRERAAYAKGLCRTCYDAQRPERQPKGLRAPKGSITHEVRLRLPVDLHEAAEAGAAREGVTVAEWCRRAVRERATTTPPRPPPAPPAVPRR